MLRSLLRRRAASDSTVRKLLRGYELPSFPAVAVRALECLADHDAPMSAVAEIVSVDPGISSRLLATTNSAAFSLRHPVRNIDHAVTLLGRDQLESMLIVISASASLPRSQARGFDHARFWRTAAQRAATARALAELIDPSEASESFTAALLQDMAIPVLSHHRSEEYGPVLERWHRGDGELIALERERFDWDHTEVADWMCSQWGFPEKLNAAIRSHHDDADDQPLPAARTVAVLREIDPEDGAALLVDTVTGRHGLERDRVTELVTTSFAEADELAALFG